ncbi:putative leucine-rich repeat domain superfamily, winged helix-like DNA-binding domain superfamily [Helianthus annuus]|nr:putative leucine-rich repeat domain superfamily, winged helix-like DNA-binding domain superfamily [Helianthus annuus]
MLEKLSGNKALLDLNESILVSLEKSLCLVDKEPELKQCYLDLRLFPEDQKIAATTLMDMWAHLYKHDNDGLATMDILDKLSSRNLATLSPKRKHQHTIANHCVEEYVMQHDVMRDLAIHLNSQKSIEHRDTLIINAYGQDLPQLPQTVNARVLSISTGERFSLAWNDIQFPKAEVFVFNFMSKMHPLPQFVQHMKKLKVLIITNYGYYFSEIQNFSEPQYLSGLTRIRLDHVSISSISTTILKLENLQKLSLIMCKIGKSLAFKNSASLIATS